MFKLLVLSFSMVFVPFTSLPAQVTDLSSSLSRPIEHKNKIPISVYDALNKDIIYGQIIPDYEALARHLQILHQQSTQFCQNQDTIKSETVRTAFIDSLSQWMHVQYVHFGPVMQQWRYSKLFFWPDTRGRIAWQLSKIIKKKENGILQSGTLQRMSPAIQSLLSVEYLLFDENSPLVAKSNIKSSRYACKLLTAISENLLNVANNIVEDWYSADNYWEVIYPSVAKSVPISEMKISVTGQIITDLNAMFDFITRPKLLMPLKGVNGKTKPRTLETWRSEQSLANITANLDVFDKLVNGWQANGQEYSGFNTSIPKISEMRAQYNKFANSADALIKTFNNDLYSTLSTEEIRKKVLELVNLIRQMQSTAIPYFAYSLDTTLGFNWTDGDF